MGLGWHIVFFRSLGFGEMNVPWSMPPWTILSLFGTFVCNAISSVVVTGSWNEASSYASWTGVSSGTGLVLYGLIGPENCHSKV